MIIRQIVKIVNTPPTAIAIKTSIWLVSVKLKVKSGVIASRDEGRDVSFSMPPTVPQRHI